MQQLRRTVRLAVGVIAAAAVIAVPAGPARADGPSCDVLYRSPMSSNWDGGFQADITITNYGAPINGWTLDWMFTDSQQVAYAYNADIAQWGFLVIATNKSWNSAIPSGGQVSFGFLASKGATNPPPPAFTLNSVNCSVEVQT